MPITTESEVRPAGVPGQVGSAPSAELKVKPKRSHSRKVLLLAFAAVGIAGAYAYYAYSHHGTSQTTVLTAAVSYGDIENSVSASGTLQPKRYVDVGAQVSGQLKKLHVARGDRVNSGDLIAEIDPQSYLNDIDAQTAQINNLKAQLKEKEATLWLKRSVLTRSEGLRTINAASGADLETAQADVNVTEAQIESLNAQIAQAQYQLSGYKLSLTYTKIYAPLSGRVVSVSYNEGQTLNANQSAPVLLRIADLDTMTVQAEVSEADVPKLKLGMDARFNTLGQPDRAIPGRLTEIEPTPQTTNNVVLYYALFDVPNPDGSLMIDMSTEVFFVAGSVKHVLTVPYSALSAIKDGSAHVRVIDDTGKANQRTVSIGLTNRVSAQVLSGLSEGDKVVVATANSDASANKDSGLGGPPPF